MNCLKLNICAHRDEWLNLHWIICWADCLHNFSYAHSLYIGIELNIYVHRDEWLDLCTLARCVSKHVPNMVTRVLGVYPRSTHWQPKRLRIHYQSKVIEHHITHKSLYITQEGSCGKCGNCGITGTVLSHFNRDIGRISMRTHRFHFKHVLSCKNTSLKRYFKLKRSFTK